MGVPIPRAGNLRNAVREIVLDTETIGLVQMGGDRIVEIGAVQLINRSPTGSTFHRYVCPERAMPADAVARRIVSLCATC
jgi:DNA polymerase III epsilon subunit-like protein